MAIEYWVDAVNFRAIYSRSTVQYMFLPCGLLLMLQIEYWNRTSMTGTGLHRLAADVNSIHSKVSCFCCSHRLWPYQQQWQPIATLLDQIRKVKSLLLLIPGRKFYLFVLPFQWRKETSFWNAYQALLLYNCHSYCQYPSQKKKKKATANTCLAKLCSSNMHAALQSHNRNLIPFSTQETN